MRRHAGMGVASFVIGIIGMASMILCSTISGSISGNALPGEDYQTIEYILGGWTFGTEIFCLVGIVFGVGGLLQKQRRRALAVSGLIINIIVPLTFMFIVIVSLTLSQSDPKYKERQRRILEHADPAPWRTPFSRCFQVATVGMAGAVFVVFRRKAKRSRDAFLAAKATANLNAICPRCFKRTTKASSFCSRCGWSMVSDEHTDQTNRTDPRFSQTGWLS
jgi:hypothetical protein